MYKYVFEKDISMVVMYGASDDMECDKRGPEISNALYHMEQETTNIE